MKRKDEDVQIGIRLKELRVRLGYTQDYFAEIFDIGCDQYKRIENGTSKISVDKIKILYDKFHIDPTYLVIGKMPEKIDVEGFLVNSSNDQRKEFINRVLEYVKKVF